MGRKGEGSSAVLKTAITASHFQEFSSWLSDRLVAQSAMTGEFIHQKLPNVTSQHLVFPGQKASLPAYPRREGRGECGWLLKRLQILNLCGVGRGQCLSGTYPSVHLPLHGDKRKVLPGDPGVSLLTDFPFPSSICCNSRTSLHCK